MLICVHLVIGVQGEIGQGPHLWRAAYCAASCGSMWVLARHIAGLSRGGSKGGIGIADPWTTVFIAIVFVEDRRRLSHLCHTLMGALVMERLSEMSYCVAPMA
jgi:hypothetical protein